jgi:rhodanese-related sulfurtransferase
MKRCMPPLLLALLAVLALPAPGFAATQSERPSWWEAARQEAEQEGYALIDTEELETLLASPPDDLLVLDVRPDYEYEAGHVGGAVNLEFSLAERMDLSPAKEQALRSLLGPDPDRPVVVYCRSFR